MRAGLLARVMGESARKDWGKVKAKVDGRVDDGWGAAISSKFVFYSKNLDNQRNSERGSLGKRTLRLV